MRGDPGEDTVEVLVLDAGGPGPLLGHPWNHKRVHRVYCALKLNLPRRSKRRVPTRLRQPLVAPSGLNGIWALDFMHDALYSGRPFRTLNVLDEGNREALEGSGPWQKARGRDTPERVFDAISEVQTLNG